MQQGNTTILSQVLGLDINQAEAVRLISGKFAGNGVTAMHYSLPKDSNFNIKHE
jgi:hypothetical protein